MDGTYVYLWLIHGDVWQKPRRHCKAIKNKNQKKGTSTSKRYHDGLLVLSPIFSLCRRTGLPTGVLLTNTSCEYLL